MGEARGWTAVRGCAGATRVLLAAQKDARLAGPLGPLCWLQGLASGDLCASTARSAWVVGSLCCAESETDYWASTTLEHYPDNRVPTGAGTNGPSLHQPRGDSAGPSGGSGDGLEVDS